MSTRPTPGSNHTAQWPPLETLAAPVVTFAATVAPTLKAEQASQSGGQGVGTNPDRGGGGTGGGRAGEEERINSIAYNNAYVEGRWGLLWHAGAMRLITHIASLASVELSASPVDLKCKICPAFHIKGMCNMGCGNATNHVAHTQEQDPPPSGDGPRGQ